MQEIKEARAAAQKRFAAMVAGDVDAIAALLDDRLIYTHASGVVDTRESYIAGLNKNEYVYHSAETISAEPAIVDGNLVIENSLMAFSITARFSGQTLSRRVRVTEVWARGAADAEWRLLLWHSTHVA